MDNQLRKEENADNPVFFVYNTNSNSPGVIHSYPAIPLQFFQFTTPETIHIYNVNGQDMGMVR